MMKRVWLLLLLLQGCGMTGGGSLPVVVADTLNVPATTDHSLAATTEIKVYPRLSYFTQEWGAEIIVTGDVEPRLAKCKRYRCAGPVTKGSEPGCYRIGMPLTDLGLSFLGIVVGDTTYEVRLLRLPEINNHGEQIDYLTLSEDQRELLYNTPVSNLLDGREVVIASAFYYSMFEQLVRLNGGVCKDRISKTTDYLVYDFDLDPKLSAEAERFGVRVLSEEQFRRLIHSQS